MVFLQNPPKKGVPTQNRQTGTCSHSSQHPGIRGRSGNASVPDVMLSTFESKPGHPAVYCYQGIPLWRTGSQNFQGVPHFRTRPPVPHAGALRESFKRGHRISIPSSCQQVALHALGMRLWGELSQDLGGPCRTSGPKPMWPTSWHKMNCLHGGLKGHQRRKTT